MTQMSAPHAPTTPLVRVLTADDHLEFRSTARDLIRATPGFVAIAEVDCGEQAVDFAIAQQADFVIMDVHMAGIGGIEATRRILSVRPATVLTLVSAYAAEDLPLEAWTCGATAILRKDCLRPRVLTRLWEIGAERRPEHPLTTV
jgi:DNA-binding NarL/FixJ family response regulator